MPVCSVLLCKNQSKTQNVANGSISYHRFPKDDFIKEKWIDATGKRDWMPTKYSTICSNHFLPDEFIISKKGNRFLIPTAVPTQEIVIFVNNRNVEIDTFTESTATSNQFGLFNFPKDNTCNETITDESSQVLTYATPNEKRLMDRLRWSELKIEKQDLKIKRLKSQNLRYRRKIGTLEDTLKNLKEGVCSGE